jgi:type II restriction enzyme
MSKLTEAREIINALGLPKEQQNDRTALCLLALINLSKKKDWKKAEARMIGITPLMEWIAKHYDVKYKPNSRETIRDESVQQMVNAGMAIANPDDPSRAKNSSKNVYQIEQSTLELLQTVGSKKWDKNLAIYLESRATLSQRYAKEREMVRVPVKYAEGKELKLSPGAHSLLIKAIIEEFGSRFVPGGQLIYVGDTGSKWGGFFDDVLFAELGLKVDTHGKMPDVILYYPGKGWLLLIESVTSNGPMDGKRHEELTKLFSKSKAPVVYVTAFPSRKVMAPFLSVIAWETEVWCADAPTHLIHFNGIRFLGPYSNK